MQYVLESGEGGRRGGMQLEQGSGVGGRRGCVRTRKLWVCGVGAGWQGRGARSKEALHRVG